MAQTAVTISSKMYSGELKICSRERRKRVETTTHTLYLDQRSAMIRHPSFLF